MTYFHSSYGAPRKKKNRFKKFLWSFFFVLLFAVAGIAYFAYGVIYKPNVWTADGKALTIKIPTGSDYEDLKKILFENGLIIHRNNFEWVVDYKKFGGTIKPGNYEINNGLSNNELINLLRSGNQTPIKVIFNNIRDISHLAQKVSPQIEADSASLVNYIYSKEFFAKTSSDSSDVGMFFIPNTYELYWNTSAEGFANRMFDEYDKFWNTKRTTLANKMGFSIKEVITLASIIEKETQKNTEKATIAGVYINRLKSKWLLQADPTLLYVLNDPSIKRVLNIHMEIDSPYNTYKHLGLPPGPICIPSVSTIDAVLNYDRNDYYFFCAKDDLSGYHVFASGIAQHNRNAKKYRKALNKLKIYK
jgi:UPF0755 protein